MRYGRPQLRQPQSTKVDKLYFIPPKGANFLFSRLQPNLLVIDTAQHRVKLPQYKNTRDKDNKHMDLFGKNLYSLVTLLLRIADYSALLFNHNFDNYTKLTSLLEYLPEHHFK